LAQLATTDGLRRLANRRSFDTFLREAYVKHAILSVLLIDIDQFKGAWATRPGTVASSALPR
jgi:GGDEF domain-containing protein